MQATSDSIGARLHARGIAPGSAGPCQAHTGADMHAGSGTPIHARRAGTVLIAGSHGAYGNAVVIDHGGAMATLYGHQSRIAVSEGNHVNAGDIIGSVGSTGLATGPHLHFEVRLSGNPIDPAPYL